MASLSCGYTVIVRLAVCKSYIEFKLPLSKSLGLSIFVQLVVTAVLEFYRFLPIQKHLRLTRNADESRGGVHCN